MNPTQFPKLQVRVWPLYSFPIASFAHARLNAVFALFPEATCLNCRVRNSGSWTVVTTKMRTGFPGMVAICQVIVLYIYATRDRMRC